MMAMIKLWKSEILKTLGWKLLLQIHDEVILEGPKESKDDVNLSFVLKNCTVLLFKIFKFIGDERGRSLYGKSLRRLRPAPISRYSIHGNHPFLAFYY